MRPSSRCNVDISKIGPSSVSIVRIAKTQPIPRKNVNKSFKSCRSNWKLNDALCIDAVLSMKLSSPSIPLNRKCGQRFGGRRFGEQRFGGQR
jgi:hypothetical protein